MNFNAHQWQEILLKATKSTTSKSGVNKTTPLTSRELSALKTRNHSLKGHIDSITCIALSLDNQTIVSCDKYRSIKVWRYNEMVGEYEMRQSIKLDSKKFSSLAQISSPNIQLESQPELADLIHATCLVLSSD